MTLEEFSAKVDAEGGLYEAVTMYGLSVDDLDEDVDPLIRNMIVDFTKKAREAREIEYDLEDLLELDTE